MKRSLALEYASLLSEAGHRCEVRENGLRSARLRIDGEEADEKQAFGLLKDSIGVAPDPKTPKQRAIIL